VKRSSRTFVAILVAFIILTAALVPLYLKVHAYLHPKITYEGDGVIKVKDPTLLRGLSVHVYFDEFDLSKPLQEHYSFKNLPRGAYLCGIWVSTSEPELKDILHGNVTLKLVDDNENTIFNKRSSLSECWCEDTIDTQHEYFIYTFNWELEMDPGSWTVR